MNKSVTHHKINRMAIILRAMIFFYYKHHRKHGCCLSKDYQRNKLISYNNGGITNDDTNNFPVDIPYHADHFLFSLDREYHICDVHFFMKTTCSSYIIPLLVSLHWLLVNFKTEHLEHFTLFYNVVELCACFYETALFVPLNFFFSSCIQHQHLLH